MKVRTLASTSLVLGLAFLAAPAAGAPPADGLVALRATRFDEVLLRPGTDFRPYTKVLLKSAEIAFHKNWLGDVNRRGATISGRVTEGEAMAILESARLAFDKAWLDAFRSAGYQVVASPGEDVLQLAPRVADLYVNAPNAPTSGISRSYVEEAGEATLHLELRDSRTGTIMGRVRDRRNTMKSATPMRVEAGTNDREFARLFADWAGTASRGLLHLSSGSHQP